MEPKTTTPNASQHHHGSCVWCKGTGKVTLICQGTKEVNCPKCGGTGKAEKITTK